MESASEEGGGGERRPLLGQPHTHGKLEAPQLICGGWTCGAAEWLSELSAKVGYKLLTILFFVEHVNRGFVQHFESQTASYVYRSYNVPAQKMQIYKGITSLPWALKPIIGLVSDVLPICGYHKTPYMLMVAVAGAASFFAVGLVPQAALPISLAVLCLSTQQFQLSTHDILTEAKYAERIQALPECGPSILTFVWFGMNFGGTVGTLMSGIVLDRTSPKVPYILFGFVASAIIFPLAFGWLEEKRVSDDKLDEIRRRFFAQKEACFLCVLICIAAVAITVCGMVSDDVRLNALVSAVVFVVMLASFSLALAPPIAAFNAWSLIQTSVSLSTADAAFYFQTDTEEMYPEGPHFSPLFFNTVLGTISSVVSLIGIATYHRYFSHWRYRNLLLIVNIGMAFLNSLDIIFYSRLNVAWGIPDRAFVLGSSALGMVVDQWQWMPQVIILSYFCPPGMEATMYALLAGCHNLGNVIASNCGAYLLLCFGVNPSGVPGESAEFASLWKASLVATALPLIPIVLLFKLVPDVKQGDKVLDPDCDATTGSLWNQWTNPSTYGSAQ